MIDFENISLMVSGNKKDDQGNIISTFVITKEKLTRYVITWGKKEIIGDEKGTNSDYRDCAMETHIRMPEFEKDLEILTEKHFELLIS